MTWAKRVPRLANPAAVIEWNTDKRYLRDLSARGVPVIPTAWVQPSDDWRPTIDPANAVCVIKPAVSHSALHTGRYDLRDAEERALAEAHVQRLQAAGRTVMVQPYLSRIESAGETSLIFLGGSFSHAMRRGAVLTGPDRGVDNRFAAGGGMQLERRQPSHAELALASRALDAVPGGRDQLLYARVDVVPGADDAPFLMELELTEPHLYFAEAPEAIARFVSPVATMP